MTTKAREGWGYVRGAELAKLHDDLTAILEALDGIAYADQTEADRQRLREKAQSLLAVVREAQEYLILTKAPQ
jgi:hypothetical protein